MGWFLGQSFSSIRHSAGQGNGRASSVRILLCVFFENSIAHSQTTWVCAVLSHAQSIANPSSNLSLCMGLIVVSQSLVWPRPPNLSYLCDRLPCNLEERLLSYTSSWDRAITRASTIDDLPASIFIPCE